MVCATACVLVDTVVPMSCCSHAAFYKNHELHTINTKPNSGFLISYKGEYFLGKRLNIIGGLEYYTQGFSFLGYYDLTGHTNVYNEIYAYEHTIAIQEVNVPMGVKIAFSTEEDTYFSSYYTGGLSLRFITDSQSLIVNDSIGVTVYEGRGDVGFENNIGKLFNIESQGKFNAFIFSGIGAQFNFRGSAKALFFEMTYRYGLSRFHYRGNNNSNDLNIKNSNLVFSFGVRF